MVVDWLVCLRIEHTGARGNNLVAGFVERKKIKAMNDGSGVLSETQIILTEKTRKHSPCSSQPV